MLHLFLEMSMEGREQVLLVLFWKQVRFFGNIEKLTHWRPPCGIVTGQESVKENILGIYGGLGGYLVMAIVVFLLVGLHTFFLVFYLDLHGYQVVCQGLLVLPYEYMETHPFFLQYKGWQFKLELKDCMENSVSLVFQTSDKRCQLLVCSTIVVHWSTFALWYSWRNGLSFWADLFVDPCTMVLWPIYTGLARAPKPSCSSCVRGFPKPYPYPCLGRDIHVLFFPWFWKGAFFWVCNKGLGHASEIDLIR